MGLIIEDFHCNGTIDCSRDRLISLVMGSAKIGAESLKNQDGKPSGPVAVGLSLSSLLKILYALMVDAAMVLFSFNFVQHKKCQ